MTENLMCRDSVKTAPRAGGLLALSLCLDLLGNASPVTGAQPTSDAKILQKAGIGRTDRDLLDFFRKRTLTDKNRRQIAHLLQQLGADEFQQRSMATRRLIALGKAFPGFVTPLLWRATRDPDFEVAYRAKLCLKAVGGGTDAALVAAAVRVLGLRKPPLTVPVLLAFLPNAGEEFLEEEIAATPAHATRLANGHTLVASSTANRIVELDAAGKPVSQRTTQGRPVRVYQR
jgi:hypothetical protein